jgi:hypothetical protein
MQQEHLSKLDINSNSISFDDLIQQQISKYYHYQNSDDDDEEEEENLDHDGRLITELDKLHDDHILWLKKKKKGSKIMAPIVERLRMFYKKFYLIIILIESFSRGTLRAFTNT